MTQATVRKPLTPFLRFGGLALILVAAALFLLPMLAAQSATAAVIESETAVSKLQENVELLKEEEGQASAKLTVAAEERATAESVATYAKASSSFFLGTFATASSVTETYDQAMQAAADAYKVVEDAHVATESKLSDAERDLAVENSAHAKLVTAEEDAISSITTFGIIAGVVVLLGIALFVASFRKPKVVAVEG